MLIGEVLELDPAREISTVVKITDHDPRRTWQEMDEYVATENVRRGIGELLDALLETRRGGTERVCAWVSGFFGSGKSHFLKVLGYLLENRQLIDPEGRSLGSTEFLCKKLGFEGFVPILTEEFNIQVIYLHLLDHDPRSEPTISQLVYRELLRTQGLSDRFEVAALERDLRELGRWEEFRKRVEQIYGRPWEEERGLHAEVVLRSTLPQLLPSRYPTEGDVNSALENARRQQISPSFVAQRLREVAERLDAAKGRLVLLLDEVRLYIGDDVRRLNDLSAFAERVVSEGQGKLLLVASAQEALTEFVPRLTADRHVLEWLRDRFRVVIGLPPTEVGKVIAHRLLRKRAEGRRRVRELFQRYQGMLSTALGGMSEEEFVELYPIPPERVELMQRVLGGMWNSLEEAKTLNAGERTMLKLVRDVLREERGRPLGWLAPLDRFYDALAPDLQRIRSETVRTIGEIERSCGSMAARVAKAVWLLQQPRPEVDRGPDQLSAAVLEEVGGNLNFLRKEVREALRELEEGGWVARDERGYRLLGRSEQEAERQIRELCPSPAQVQQELHGLIQELFRGFKYEHGRSRRELRVEVIVDGDKPPQERLAVFVFTPFSERTGDELLSLSVQHEHALFWQMGDEPELRALIERSLALRTFLERWRTGQLDEDHRRRLERELQEKEGLRLERLKEALVRGRMWWRGQELPFGGHDDPHEVLRDRLQPIARELFPHFVDLRPRDRDCAAVLSWRPGASLPEAYRQLGLISHDGQQLLSDNPHLGMVRAELNRRGGCLGRELRDRFERPPCGWDERVLRLLVATLVKLGEVGVRHQRRDLLDPGDPQLRAIFEGSRPFAGAELRPLPRVDWRHAAELLSRLFGVPGEDTLEGTARTLREQAERWHRLAERLVTRARDLELPREVIDRCRTAGEGLGRLASVEDPNALLRAFLEDAKRLEPLLKVLQKLKRFPFEEFRLWRSLAEGAREWGRAQADRWRSFCGLLTTEEALGEAELLRGEYAALWSAYERDYQDAHRRHQELLKEAIGRLRSHPAFQHDPERAQRLLRELEDQRCDGGKPEPQTAVCPRCRRRYELLREELVRAEEERVARRLDALLPKKAARVLERRVVLRSAEDVKRLAQELQRYLEECGMPVRLLVRAEPGNAGA